MKKTIFKIMASMTCILLSFVAYAQPPQWEWECAGATDASQGNRSASCSATSPAYVGRYGRFAGHVPTPNYTPTKIIKISFHFFQKNDGSNNWQNAHLGRLNTIINNWMNPRLANLPAPSDPLGAPLIPNSTIQYENTGVYFYQNDNLNSQNAVCGTAGPYEAFVNGIDPTRISNSIPIFVTNGPICNGAAAGFGMFPSETNLTQNSYVVSGWGWGGDNPLADFAFAGHLLHELGHDLELNHTYDGHQSMTATDYLSDVYNTTWWNYCNPPTNWACKHQSGWSLDPWDPTVYATNNVMGSTQAVEYLSPLQLGKINRSLALKSVRKYVKEMVSSTNNWVVSNNETWDFDIQMYQDILVTNGATLTINCRVAMANNGKITVDPGAHLIVDGGLVTAWGSMWTGIVLNPGSTLLVDNNATIENALLAIDSKGGAPFTVQNSILNKNWRNILFETYTTGTHPGVIKNSIISCVNSAGVPANALIAPYAGKRTYKGIEINNVTQVNIGVDQIGQTNTFNNIDVGISNTSSGLTVYNNNFINITSTGPGGSGYCINSTNGSTEKTLIVGGIGGNGYRKNSFTNSSWGVKENANQRVSIISNTFNNLTTGVNISNISNVGHEIYVSSNIIDNCNTGIYGYNNGGSTTFIIIDNQVNNTGNAKPNSKAISILNSSCSGANAPMLKINNNTIKRVSTGIEVTNFTAPNVETNTITEVSDLGSGIASNGILITTCPSLYIASNTVQGNSAQNSWWMTGIRLESCNNSVVLKNSVENIGRGLFFGGSCDFTETAKNNMKNNYDGFMLNYGKISGQYADGRATENTWEGTFSRYLLYSYYSDGAQSPMNLYHATPGTLKCDPAAGPCMDPIALPALSGVDPIATLGVNPIPTTEVTVVSGRSMNNWKHQEMLKIAKGKSKYPIYNESAKWVSKYNLYNMLLSDSTLQNGDADLIAFTDSVTQSSMGALCKLNKLLAQSNTNSTISLATAETINNGLITHNIVEQNLRDVFSILISNTQNNSLSSNQINKLQAIATQCPYEGGPGVYNARVILSSVDTVLYSNICEMAPPTKNRAFTLIQDEANITYIAVFPNPANNKLNVAIHLEEGQAGLLSIYDLTGKLVLSEKLAVTNDVAEISTVSLSEGMYIYKLNVNNTNVNTGKLSIKR